MKYLMVTKFNNVFSKTGEIQTYYPVGLIKHPLIINNNQNNIKTIFINLNHKCAFEGTYLQTIGNYGNNIKFIVRLDRKIEFKQNYEQTAIGWYILTDEQYKTYLPIEQETGNEFYFNLPTITELTIQQQSALNETKAIAISGGPGSGKSFVSLWRHIRNHEAKIRRSLLLTYTKPLAFYLKNSCPNNQEIRNNVNTAWRWLYNAQNQRFDEIIVDEAQDLGQGQMGDVFFDKIINHTNMISYGADGSQMLYEPPRGISESDLENRFPLNVQNVLSENFRNTLEIMQFTRYLFPNSNIPDTMIQLLREKERKGPKPILQICNNQESQKQACINIINKFTTSVHNIAILLPRIEQVNLYYNYIREFYPNATKYTSDDDTCNISNIHVATFWGSKGLEFDTVIIPNFELFQEIKIYYVGITRAKSNLFLLSNNDNLQQQVNKNFYDIENLQQQNINLTNNDMPF